MAVEAAATTTIILILIIRNKQTQKLNAIYFYWTLVSLFVSSEKSPNWYQQHLTCALSFLTRSPSLYYKRNASAHSNAIPTRIHSLKTIYCTTVHAVYNSSLVLCSSIRAPPHTNTNTNTNTHAYTHTNTNTNTNKFMLSCSVGFTVYIVVVVFGVLLQLQLEWRAQVEFRSIRSIYIHTYIQAYTRSHTRTHKRTYLTM